jgi:hypothetical protein
MQDLYLDLKSRQQNPTRVGSGFSTVQEFGCVLLAEWRGISDLREEVTRERNIHKRFNL